MADLTRSLGISIMRVNNRELPLSAIPLCQLFPCHLGPPRPALSINLYVKGFLTAPLERSTCPFQKSLFSFRMRSRSSMPSQASSSLDLVVTMSCGLTLQICLIIALSFCCRHWRFGFVNGQVSLAWSRDYSGPRFLWEKKSHLDKNNERFSNSVRFFFRSLGQTEWDFFFFFFFLFFCKGQILYQNCMYKYYYCLFCNVL